MAKYVLMLLNRGQGGRGRVLSDAGFNLFVKPVHKAESWGPNTSYAYGLAVEEADNRVVLRHTGGMVAFSSAMHVDTTNGFGAFVSVNANLERYRPNAVARYAIDLLRASAKGDRLPNPPAASGDPPIKNSDFVGKYWGEGRGVVFVVEDVNGALMLRNGETRVSLLPAGSDQFFIDHPRWQRFYLRFNREAHVEPSLSGRVVEMFYGNDWYFNDLYSGSQKFEFPREWHAFAGRYRNDSPWWGTTQIFLRKGKLWLGDDPLFDLGGGIFRVGEEESSPERVSFDGVSNGRALKMNFSGVDFYRRPDV